MSRIKEEQESAEKYMLATIKSGDCRLAALTPDNVARVEAMIRTDSKYMALWPENEENEKYSPCWIKEMGRHLGYSGLGSIKKPGLSLEAVVRKVVEKTDAENSTHLNADKGLLHGAPDKNKNAGRE